MIPRVLFGNVILPGKLLAELESEIKDKVQHEQNFCIAAMSVPPNLHDTCWAGTQHLHP
jgi:hypothetical protein